MAIPYNEIPSWDDYFIAQLRLIARRSKDQHTKLGAKIVTADNSPLADGYNSFPRGINDKVEGRFDRPEKYYWFEHAERNAIYNAARTGRSPIGATLYTMLYPCSDCARGIISVGIVRVVIDKVYTLNYSQNRSKWYEEYRRSEEMFKEAGVEVVWHG